MNRVILAAFIVAFAFQAAFPATREEITEEWQDGLELWKAGDVPGALESVRLLDAWISQFQAEQLGDIFGEIAGWIRKLGESTGVGQAMFGGASTVSCDYEKDGVTMTAMLVGNSPMANMFSGIIGGFATAGGGEVVKVKTGNKKTKAFLQKESGSLTLNVPYGSALFTVTTTGSKANAVACAEAVKWNLVDAILTGE
jgi:hypothetical protein